MIDLTPLLIGLRSAVALLCLVSIVGWLRFGLPVDPVARWRIKGWLCITITTVLAWTPLALGNMSNQARFAMPLGSFVGDLLRLQGLIGYLAALMCFGAAWSIGQGASIARVRCLWVAQLGTAGCAVAFAYLAAALWT